VKNPKRAQGTPPDRPARAGSPTTSPAVNRKRVWTCFSAQLSSPQRWAWRPLVRHHRYARCPGSTKIPPAPASKTQRRHPHHHQTPPRFAAMLITRSASTAPAHVPAIVACASGCPRAGEVADETITNDVRRDSDLLPRIRRGPTMINARRLLLAAADAIAATLSGFAGMASADPICGTPGTPPCAGPNPMTPEQQCAWIAWRTWTPCNWFGMQVPTGTPGSLG
jgi:hypothetical protein